MASIREELGIDQNRWIQNGDYFLPTWLSQKMIKEARVLEKKTQYDEALKKLLLADKYCPSPDLNLEIAICYAHLHRAKEALALEDRLPEYSWNGKVEIYDTLGMYEKALQACDDSTMNFDQPILLKANLLLVHGDREKAIKTAQEGYWHFVREGANAEKIGALLQGMQVEPTPPPEIKSDNAAVMESLEKLPRLKKAPGISEVERMFGRQFKTGEQDPGRTDHYIDVETIREARDIFSYVRFTYNRFAPSASLIVEPTVDSTFISKYDIIKMMHKTGIVRFDEQIFGESVSEPPHGDGKPYGGGTSLSYECRNGRLEFKFLKNGQLREVERGWNDSATEAEEYRLANLPTDAQENDLDVIETKLAAGDFEKCTRLLLPLYPPISSINRTQSIVYKWMCKKRELLARCYEGMHRSDIAMYLRTAPVHHIERLGGVGSYLSVDQIFPTYDQYMHTRWFANGDAEKTKGHYYINSLAGCEFTVNAQSPLYASLFSILGPMHCTDNIKIKPLPALLVDEAMYESYGF